MPRKSVEAVGVLSSDTSTMALSASLVGRLPARRQALDSAAIISAAAGTASATRGQGPNHRLAQ